jgi:uncharacterized peroxidase-related enzyme
MSAVVHELTARPLRWSPYLAPVRLDEASPQQLEAMKVTPSNRKVSDYVLTLAHDPESLAVRSPLYNAIMYGRDGLPAADRELGALAASVFNRCLYCVSVHAARYVQLSKRQDVVDAVLADGEATAGLDERSQAVFDFAVRLSAAPPRASADDIAALRRLGLGPLEILDLVLAAGIFGWANRLMHTLGEPVEPQSEPDEP